MMISAVLVATILSGAHVIANKPSPLATPSVISTFPTQNAVIDAGPINLSVTFDRRMRRQSYSFVKKSAETYPHCGRNQPAQSADGLTFTLKCEIQAGHRYEIWFNSPPYMNFVDENGTPAVPFGLRFRSK